MNSPDRFPQHVGNRQHFQLREHSILGNGNAISHNHLLKQSLSRQSLGSRWGKHRMGRTGQHPFRPLLTQKPSSSTDGSAGIDHVVDQNRCTP